jgi:hypothetical protein
MKEEVKKGNVLMIKTEFPWQSLPANLIAYGCHHCSKDGEFEQQVGFLLLDVGVETTLNTLRTLPDNVSRVRTIEKKLVKPAKEEKESEFQLKITDVINLEKTTFHFLVSIARELVTEGMEDNDWRKLEYFHSIRNKLYHQGDGVTTTSANASDYANLAKKLLLAAIGIEIESKPWADQETPEQRKGILKDFWFISYDTMATELATALDELADELGLITEVLRPKYTSMKFLVAVKHIRDDLLGLEDRADEIETKAAIRADRKQALNDLLGVDLDDFETIDLIVKDPRYIWFHVGLKKLCGKKFGQEFDEYLSARSFIEDVPIGIVRIKSRNPDDGFVQKSAIDPDEIYNEYEILLAWTEKLVQKARTYHKKMDAKKSEK